MLLTDFDFVLPEERIAKAPLPERTNARLLLYERKTHQISHHQIKDLPKLLSPNDRLVFNNTRVLHARLLGQEPSTLRRFELLLLRAQFPLVWSCLVKPGKHVHEKVEVAFDNHVSAYVEKTADGFCARFTGVDEPLFLNWLMKTGTPPLPPYIRRPSTEEDKERYQTVYARPLGSVAAPTAGLHFSTELLQQLLHLGIKQDEITLHVGYGTFGPIRSEKVEEHTMHEEFYEVTPETWERLDTARSQNQRVIAIGTTSLRTLESASQKNKLSGDTNLYIYPGYQFNWTGGLLTNFHLPKSSLFILICALIGREQALRCYQTALSENYRFYSYGDAMLIL